MAASWLGRAVLGTARDLLDPPCALTQRHLRREPARVPCSASCASSSRVGGLVLPSAVCGHPGAWRGGSGCPTSPPWVRVARWLFQAAFGLALTRGCRCLHPRQRLPLQHVDMPHHVSDALLWVDCRTRVWLALRPRGWCVLSKTLKGCSGAEGPAQSPSWSSSSSSSRLPSSCFDCSAWVRRSQRSDR